MSRVLLVAPHSQKFKPQLGIKKLLARPIATAKGRFPSRRAEAQVFSRRVAEAFNIYRPLLRESLTFPQSRLLRRRLRAKRLDASSSNEFPYRRVMATDRGGGGERNKKYNHSGMEIGSFSVSLSRRADLTSGTIGFGAKCQRLELPLEDGVSLVALLPSPIPPDPLLRALLAC